MMYRKIMLLFFCLVLCGPLHALAKKNNGPETMDLKKRFKVEGKREAVIFPHHQHQAKLKCDKCHVSPDGGGALRFEIVKKDGMSNDYHKKFCWPCHAEMNVPKGRSCNTCHKK